MPPPHLGSLPHSQALLAFWASAQLAKGGWTPNPRGIHMIVCLQKGLAWRVLTNMERTVPICLLVSRIHQVGAKGEAKVVVRRQSRATAVSHRLVRVL